MKNKFLTQQARIDNLKNRGNKIKETFKKEFNKIKRIDEVAVRQPDEEENRPNLHVYQQDPNAEKDVNESHQADEQFSNINFNLGERAFITGHVIKEEFNEIIGGQKIQGAIQIDVHSYEGGTVDKSPNLAIFLQYVCNSTPEGTTSYLNLYSRGDNKGALIDNISNENFKQYIQRKLIDKLDAYSAQKISEMRNDKKIR